MHEEIRTIEGASELIKALFDNGFRIAVCSSSSLSAIRFGLEKLKIINLIDTIVSGDDTALGKPMADPYLLVLNNMGISPTEAIVFEDSIAGINSANAAGILTFAVNCDSIPVAPKSAIINVDCLCDISLSN